MQSLVWTRPPREFADFDVEPELVVDLFSLMEAFRKILGQLKASERLKLQPDLFSVAEKIEWLTGRLEEAGSLPFLDVISSLKSRSEMIALFLALLEIIRQRVAIAHQKTPLGEIWISLRPISVEEASPLTPESISNVAPEVAHEQAKEEEF